MRFHNNLLQFTNHFFKPIPIGLLVLARIAFGLLMLWEVERYFTYTRVERYYIQPTFHFHYFGFEWLSPLPGHGMTLLFIILGILAVLIFLGMFYRLSMAAFWVLFTYVFLLDEAQYLNHFYLISLISFLMIWIPAHRALSIDAWLRPQLQSKVVPAWSLYILRLQMAIVYFFGGVAKINPDWLRGEPMREWLASRTDFPMIGGLFTEEWAPYFFSYGGLLLDLLIVPMLLWRRMRWLGLLLSVGFHVTNSELFNIGIFPWMAIAFTLLFLPPEWFRLGGTASTQTRAFKLIRYKDVLMLGAFGLFFMVQIALPLRHFFFPGYVSWTEEGHNLAWHMRLRDKDGDVRFYASDPETGSTRIIPVESYLSDRQYSKMRAHPQMIQRMAHYLVETDYPGMQIRVWAMANVNSRASQLLIDPTVDLSKEVEHLGANDWVLPLVQPPSPDGVPGLLVAKEANAILLINITEEIFPIGEFGLQTGEYTILGADLGLSQLQSGGCVILHEADADWSSLFPICNEEGRFLIEALPMSFDVRMGYIVEPCEGATCIVVAPNSP